MPSNPPSDGLPKRKWSWKRDIQAAQALPRDGTSLKNIAPPTIRLDRMRFRQGCGHTAGLIVERIARQLENADALEASIKARLAEVDRTEFDNPLEKGKTIDKLLDLLVKARISLPDLASVLPVLADRAGLLAPKHTEIDAEVGPTSKDATVDAAMALISSQIASLERISKERQLDGNETDLLLSLTQRLQAIEAQRAEFVLRAMNSENVDVRDRKKIVNRFLGAEVLQMEEQKK